MQRVSRVQMKDLLASIMCLCLSVYLSVYLYVKLECVLCDTFRPNDLFQSDLDYRCNKGKSFITVGQRSRTKVKGAKL